MRKISLNLIAIIQIAFLLSLYSCSSNNNLTPNEVKIGDQVWMTQNLSTDTFQNGDKIIQVKSMKDWDKSIEDKQAAWCYYEFNETYGEKYGKIYNSFAVIDTRKLAPGEWRIPNEREWKILTINLDPNADTAKFYLDESFNLKKSKAAEKLKSDEWNGTNESKFDALPGGFIWMLSDDRGYGGQFSGINSSSMWWLSNSENDRFCGYLIYNEGCYFENCDLGGGYYVRCVK
jgi:uncharacterized protein (TIGR02145 family)